MNDNGFGDTGNQAVHSLAADGSSLFAGVANSDGVGGKVFASVQAPIVTTQAVTDISTTTATGNGTITDLGYSNSTAHGVRWNTTCNPTIADNFTDEGAAAATGAFTSAMTALSPNTAYYVRVYATNAAGTAYGAQVSFTTLPDAPTASATPSEICARETSTLAVTSTTTDLSFEWFTGSCGAISAGTGTSIDVTPTETTTYYVRSTSASVNSIAWGEVTVTVNALPLGCTITAPATVAFSSTGNMASIVEGATPGATYNWTVYVNGSANNALITSPNPQGASINWTAPDSFGTIDIGVTVTTAQGCVCDNDPPVAGQYPGNGVDIAPQQQVPIPTVSEWGMIIFSLLLAGSAIVFIRKGKPGRITANRT